MLVKGGLPDFTRVESVIFARLCLAWLQNARKGFADALQSFITHIIWLFTEWS
ncbi:hypothetical protein QCE63_23260 [Caballeronia sp. LZ065]|uniref:hypothetical protein n=1 Tax=Caballeronia sp. LZ065 TaxID=3038571 RepID=UPI00285601B3|nr:hypothetical protein [Caballeronia sp. LZ065]MDR5782326.1 hypothetical protein [Caballeronia sp. LZ065]